MVLVVVAADTAAAADNDASADRNDEFELSWRGLMPALLFFQGLSI